jgi:hypothetical protein
MNRFHNDDVSPVASSTAHNWLRELMKSALPSFKTSVGIHASSLRGSPCLSVVDQTANAPSRHYQGDP